MADTDDLSAYEFDDTADDFFENGGEWSIASFTTGKIGNAAAADNGSAVTDVASFGYLVTGGTIAFWINLTQDAIDLSGGLFQFLFNSGTHAVGVVIDTSGGNLNIYCQAASVTVTEPTPGWKWIVLTRVGSSTQVYVNNVAIGSPITAAAGVDGSPAGDAMSWSDNYGTLDQLLVSPNVFSSDFRARIYNSGSGRPASEFVAVADAGAPCVRLGLGIGISL